MSIARVMAASRRRLFAATLGTTIALSMAPVPAHAGELIGSGTLGYESSISPGLALSSDPPQGPLCEVKGRSASHSGGGNGAGFLTPQGSLTPGNAIAHLYDVTVYAVQDCEDEAGTYDGQSSVPGLTDEGSVSLYLRSPGLYCALEGKQSRIHARVEMNLSGPCTLYNPSGTTQYDANFLVEGEFSPIERNQSGRVVLASFYGHWVAR